MSELAIKVENLSKLYHIGAHQEKYATLRNALVSGVKRLTTKRSAQEKEANNLWALKDVSFDIKQSEVVGIIGRNGAGKSTLLKVLAHITEPTSGRVSIYGRVGSLLEVGTGFHPELTGHDNIYLNGAILGMKRAEIDRKFDEIVAFAEIEKFLDTPVKRYSSGMYVRLAFAVAAHLEPEILVVDEVLAVGDVIFQQKCLNKMDDVAQQGRTILFVSHNLKSIRSLCKRGLLLSDGGVVVDSDVGTAIEKYLLGLTGITSSTANEISWDESTAPGNSGFHLRKIELMNIIEEGKAAFAREESFVIRVHYQLTNPQPEFRVVLQVVTTSGEIAFSSSDQHKRFGEYCLPGMYVSSCTVPDNLLNLGEYILRVIVGTPGVRFLLQPTDFLRFMITDAEAKSADYESYQNLPGIFSPQLEWSVERRDNQ